MTQSYDDLAREMVETRIEAIKALERASTTLLQRKDAWDDAAREHKKALATARKMGWDETELKTRGLVTPRKPRKPRSSTPPAPSPAPSPASSPADSAVPPSN